MIAMSFASYVMSASMHACCRMLSFHSASCLYCHEHAVSEPYSVHTYIIQFGVAIELGPVIRLLSIHVIGIEDAPQFMSA